MSDDRSHLGETHIQRINNWLGSDSYVEGARRDPEDIDMPSDEPTFPYVLLEKAQDPITGILKPQGEIVYLRPNQIGPHHAKLPGVEYPPDAAPALPPFISRGEHEAAIAALKQRIMVLEVQVKEAEGPAAKK